MFLFIKTMDLVCLKYNFVNGFAIHIFDNMWTKEVYNMKKKLKVKFMNEFDVNVFDEYFYKHILNNVASLLQKKEEK